MPGLQLAKCEGSRLQVALSPGDGDTRVSSSALDPPLAPALGVVVTDLFVAPAHWEQTLVTGSRPNLGRVRWKLSLPPARAQPPLLCPWPAPHLLTTLFSFLSPCCLPS